MELLILDYEGHSNLYNILSYKEIVTDVLLKVAYLNTAVYYEGPK